MSFSKLLVANRGEISVRVIRGCRELGIETVAVYSEADAGAMHRRLAGESYLLGPAPAAESYLNLERIMEVVRESCVDAVHPGYGFLAESPAFARAVEEAGVVWVGPPPEAMELAGSKLRAKKLAESSGVPTVPDSGGMDVDRLTEAAERIGYPVLVKASAGGGGRGMRVVQRPEALAEAIESASREAEAAFGDGSVFLEKLLDNPWHVEVQVLGDAHGNFIHLYERECSIQRRYQKVVEEAPSPALGVDLRKEICGAAVRLAREAGYCNAGTVEFLLDGDDFYFLEMNARLQVEHPVTELVTGLDLVHLQLAIAAGEALPLTQDEVSLRGSSIEARIYAEDDEGRPTGGRLLAFIPPEGPGIRNDAGFEVGDEVPINYDPMLAKLIVHSPDRPLSVRRLRHALDRYEVLGMPTNLPLLRRIADHPTFAAGRTTTGFLMEHQIDEVPEQQPVPREVLLVAAAAELHRSPSSPDPFVSGSWRLLGATTLRYDCGGETRRIEAARLDTGKLRLTLDGMESVVRVTHAGDGRLRAFVDGSFVDSGLAFVGTEVWISMSGTSYRLMMPSLPGGDETGLGDDSAAASLTVPMPGTVVKVLVAEGDEVEEGQVILVMEAMKMEQPVVAPHGGRVRAIPYGEGSLVPGGAVLAEIDEAQTAPGR